MNLWHYGSHPTMEDDIMKDMKTDGRLKFPAKTDCGTNPHAKDLGDGMGRFTSGGKTSNAGLSDADKGSGISRSGKG